MFDQVSNDFMLISCYFLKDATSEIKTSVTSKAPSKDFGADSMVISSPVRPVIASSEEHIELEKTSSANLMPDTAEDLRSPVEFNAANGEELIRLEQAATKAQAAFRGYLVILLSLINLFCMLKSYVYLFHKTLFDSSSKNTESPSDGIMYQRSLRTCGGT